MRVPGSRTSSGSVTRTWRNSEALLARALEVTPDNHVAHNNLGYELAKQGRLDEASAPLRDRDSPRARAREGASEPGRSARAAGERCGGDRAAQLPHGCGRTIRGPRSCWPTRWRAGALRRGRDPLPGSHRGGSAVARHPEQPRRRPCRCGRPEAAVRQFQASLALYPDNTNAHLNAARALDELSPSQRGGAPSRGGRAQPARGHGSAAPPERAAGGAAPTRIRCDEKACTPRLEHLQLLGQRANRVLWHTFIAPAVPTR